MTVGYGKTTPTSYADPEVRAINLSLARMGVTMRPGAHLVDTFPFLKYIPGYLSHLRRYGEEEKALFTGLVQMVREHLVRFGWMSCTNRDH